MCSDQTAKQMWNRSNIKKYKFCKINANIFMRQVGTHIFTVMFNINDVKCQ